jgi:antirestriction protein ArdC
MTVIEEDEKSESDGQEIPYIRKYTAFEVERIEGAAGSSAVTYKPLTA